MTLIEKVWREVLLGLVGVIVGLTTAISSASLSNPATNTAVGAAAGVALVGARRWPWPVLVAESVLVVVASLWAPFGTAGPVLAAGTALAFVAFESGWASTVAAFVLFTSAIMTSAIIEGADGTLSGTSGLLRLVLLTLFCAAPVAFGRYLGSLRDAAVLARHRIADGEARRESETRLARLAERAAIARDLHDIVAHHIGAIALQAGAAEFATKLSGRADDAVEVLGEVRAAAGHVLDELRELLDVLRDPGSVDATEPMVEPEQIIGDAERITRAAGLDVRVDVHGLTNGMPLVLRTTAARVVQEGLTNSLKHAGPGARVRVDVRPDAASLLVEVSDGGPVRQRPAGLPTSGYGLSGMRERVGLLGGSLAAGPTATGGWQLQARLPIREPA